MSPLDHQGRSAEGEGVEPSYPCGRQLSKPVRYQFRTPFRIPCPAARVRSVDPPGIEPGLPVRQTGVIPLDHEPVEPSGVAGS